MLCSDVEYKTLSINYSTTAREMIRLLLNKFRIKHKDPNLFYLTMEVWIRKTGIPIRSVMILDDMACPAQIQASYPHQDTKYVCSISSQKRDVFSKVSFLFGFFLSLPLLLLLDLKYLKSALLTHLLTYLSFIQTDSRLL